MTTTAFIIRGALRSPPGWSAWRSICRLRDALATVAPAVAALTVQRDALTTYDDEESVVAALSAGAIGHLTKDGGRDDIHRPVGRRRGPGLARGGSPGPPARRPARPGAEAGFGAGPGTGTGREVDVLSCIARGLSNAGIAARLFVGEATVKTRSRDRPRQQRTPTATA